jgi:branched-chain amino acid transport system ATP-binding protein
MSTFELKRLALVALGLVLLPIVLSWGGLTYSTAVECVVLALAGLALNVLLGYTGLVSFGHGAWFGIGGYAVAILQLRVFEGSTLLPLVSAIAIVALIAVVVGFIFPC